MNSDNLISMWKDIREQNRNYDIKQQETQKNQCLCALTYEELITNELLKRGLFDFALNECYRKKELRIISKYKFYFDFLNCYN